MKILPTVSPGVQVELLDILNDFALTAKPSPGNDGRTPKRDSSWEIALGVELEKHREQFDELRRSENEEIADFAAGILSELSG